MIDELLEERDNLFEIASVLYGDIFVTNESFWGSPTELQLQRVYERLDLFGHQDDEPTDEMNEAAEIIKKMVDKGKNNKN